MCLRPGPSAARSRSTRCPDDALVNHWQARVAGKGARVLQWFVETAAAVATPIVKSRRGPLAESANPAAGDILRYQARPEPICDHVPMRSTASPTTLPARAQSGRDHLRRPAGQGVAAEREGAHHRRVAGAVSARDRCAARTRDRCHKLPRHFPPWLNLYDPYDFLSYVAEPIFRHGVMDCRIESGQPFPYSHSAYWTNPDTWAAIRAFLP